MNYEQAIDWLYATQQFGIKLGLEQPLRLLRELDAYPPANVKVIHVAGTNGKGSTCAMIDALARSSGLRCGLFTSPHLVDFRERVCVNGREISEAETAHYLTRIKQRVTDWEHHPTFFELTLVLGMTYFKHQGCELITLETGMGGRLDATTAVPADVAVITPVAMDHSQWLGETLTEIAAEKAGIMVTGKPTVSSVQHSEVSEVLLKHAHQIDSPIEFVPDPYTASAIGLAGSHQLHNAALAIAATQRAEIPTNAKIISDALAHIQWPGRFEHCPAPHSPHGIILDAAHNPQAAEALVKTWQQQYADRKATIIFGAVEGKNTAVVISILSEIAAHIHLTPIDSPRSLTLDELAKSINTDTPHTIHEHPAAAIDNAHQQASESPVLICGSIFLIGQIKAALSQQNSRPSNQ
ncbi:MAG: bifunctional folylpolyglutamate synthase/dihydrofolate synthase [Akkermansiaceae bacterium]|nr:bifunctional folylpolyglutamate synthase/dihydrofolate synthase [Akkermansiaceae bacterium]